MRAIPERLRDASCGGAIKIVYLYLLTLMTHLCPQISVYMYVGLAGPILCRGVRACSISCLATRELTPLRRVTQSWATTRRCLTDVSVRESVSLSALTTTPSWCRNNASPANSTSVGIESGFLSTRAQ